MDDSTRSRRLIWLVAAVSIAALGVGARLYEIQIRRGDQFRAIAKQQQEDTVTIPAVRGAILDRDLRDLAVSVAKELLYVHPERIETPEQSRRYARLLSPVIDVDQADLERIFNGKKSFAYLKRSLSTDDVAEIRQLELPMGGDSPFGFLPHASRLYPRGVLGSHVIGFANIDGKGIEGIERQFNHALRGDDTVYLLRRDATVDGGFREPIRTPDKHPHDVVLTVDAVLQHVVERELDEAMRKTGSRNGSVVVLDVATGEILALANRPAADLNLYNRSTPNQRLNRAVVSSYEPGSTFKVVSMAAALEERIVTPAQRFHCNNGVLLLDDRRIRDSSPHGVLTLREIFAKSSNIGMVKASSTIQKAALHRWIREFGFGEETGVELPGESQGILAPVHRWSGYTRDSLAFGHEINVTPLQMASALAIVANDGVHVPPRVVRGLRDHEGNFHPAPRPRPRQVLSAGVTRELRLMMEQVITDGTGRRATVPGYRVAGKTGTAQKPTGNGYSNTEYVASFGGYAPAGQPRLVGLVVLDTPRGEEHQGGQVAAPVFSRVMAEALRHLRVPNDEDLLPPPLPRQITPSLQASGAAHDDWIDGTVPDLVGLDMRAAVSRLASAGYPALVEGNGRVRTQDPAAGAQLALGEPCKIVLMEALR